MRSFVEWLQENNLLNEFDPNRGAAGRSVPALYSGKDFPGKEEMDARRQGIAGPQFTLDNPATRAKRLNQILSYIQVNGPHEGMKIIRDSETKDPDVKKIMKRFGGYSRPDDLTATTTPVGDYDKSSPSNREYDAETALFRNINKKRNSLVGKEQY